MTVSGTVSATLFDTGKVIDAAFRRARISSPQITAEMLQIARDCLYLFLSSAPSLGMQLWAVEQGSISPLVLGQEAYTLPAGTVDLTGLPVLRTTLAGVDTDIPMYRSSQDDWTNLPNKAFQGRPVQLWLDRQRDAPVMRIWPTADAYSVSNCSIVYWRKRQIMDVGSLTDTLDIPQRWYDAVVWKLAHMLACECPDAKPEVIPMLKAESVEALARAQNEERDNSPIRLVPRIAGYSR